MRQSTSTRLEDIVCPNVGFTGTQELITEAQYMALWWLLNKIDPACCHHGDCIGADSYFHLLVAHMGRNLCIHPPRNPEKRAFCNTGHRVMMPEADYLDRNKNIVEDSDILIACPRTFEEELRSGTWSTVRYARKRKLHIFIIYPDGSVRYEEPRR